MVQVLPGECYVSRGGEVIATVLGSCVSTCMRDLRGSAGGMNHFMLAEGTRGGWGANESTRYGNFAMEKLINELLKAGARRDRLEAKKKETREPVAV